MEVSCYKRRKFADRDDIYPQAGTVCGYLSYYISQSETDICLRY